MADRIVKPCPCLGLTFHEAFRVRIIGYRSLFGRQRWRAKLESRFMDRWRGVSNGMLNLGFVDFSGDVQQSFKTEAAAEKAGNQWLDEIEQARLPGKVIEENSN